MSFQVFSNTVAELYALGEHAAPDKLPAEMLRVIRQVIHFDKAIWGIGRFNKTLPSRLEIEQAQVYDTDENLLRDYVKAAGESLDPVFGSLLENLPIPLRCDAIDYYSERNLPGLCDFACNYGLRKMLMYGQAPDACGDHLRWVGLYRDEDRDFSEADAQVLRALWAHLLNAIRISLKRALEQIDPQRMERPVALVDSHGEIKAANMAWNSVLKREWPAFNERSLPLSALTSLIDTGIYRAKQIEITGSPQFGYLACMVRTIPPATTMLAPSELNVADGFAKGMTHTQIASRLKVSPHTVRNQLAQVYQKLGIHSKAELARMLAAR